MSGIAAWALGSCYGWKELKPEVELRMRIAGVADLWPVRRGSLSPLLPETPVDVDGNGDKGIQALTEVSHIQ